MGLSRGLVPKVKFVVKDVGGAAEFCTLYTFYTVMTAAEERQ